MSHGSFLFLQMRNIDMLFEYQKLYEKENCSNNNSEMKMHAISTLK